jgi:hypothetical protein
VNERLIQVLVIVGALIALLAAAVTAFKVIDGRGHARGQAEERAVWEAREARELAEANAKIIQLTTRARKLERDAAARTTADNDARRAADEQAAAAVSGVGGSVRDGLRELCDGRAAGREGADQRAEGAAPGAASGADGADRTEFFTVVGDFLSAEAARADRVARKLGQAQALIRVYLATCNAAEP